MRQINLFVIHCSATPNSDSLFRVSPGTSGSQTPVQAIDAWHKGRGFHRDAAARSRFNPALESIGYHYVIYRNGALATGRSEGEIGAHALGFNANSIGICLVGTDAYTRAQWETLKNLVQRLQGQYSRARIKGHRDLSPDKNRNGKVEPSEWLKTCPGFDVSAWVSSRMSPLSNHLLEKP